MKKNNTIQFKSKRSPSLSSVFTVTDKMNTCLSDLQEAWVCLREAVLMLSLSGLQQQLLFHIDRGTSWECVRDLTQMKKALEAIINLAYQAKVENSEILYWILTIHGYLTELVAFIQGDELEKGEKRKEK